MRVDGRTEKQLRKIEIIKDYTMHAEGSVLYCQGNTKVICTATVEESIPPYLLGTGKGWVTAEYSMLPRATVTRNKRDIAKLKQAPRSTEIQRLIGRALRGAVDLTLLDMRTGREVDMGSPFDLFSPLSHPDCRAVTEEQYENRMRLQRAMVRNGFSPIDCEWWHFALADEPYPDTYFEFPVSAGMLRR